jgi:SAM-dependent methyltransferase
VSDGVFDAAVAERYDDDVAGMFAPEVLGPAVDFLASLAGKGRALEFAIGTGRVGLALRERGVDVAGIELSSAMVRQLRAKPGGADVEVAMGDMTSTRVEGEFSLVYLVFNTIGNLLTQDEQVRCFENAAAHLAPGGAFVIELEVPQVRRMPPGQRFVPFRVEGGYAGIDEYDLVTQRLDSRHYSINDDGTGGLFVTPQRFAWPSELDLMARIAGLELHERWANWNREPFTADSDSHVSVWVKP